jgi:hypothetical protein
MDDEAVTQRLWGPAALIALGARAERTVASLRATTGASGTRSSVAWNKRLKDGKELALGKSAAMDGPNLIQASSVSHTVLSRSCLWPSAYAAFVASSRRNLKGDERCCGAGERIPRLLRLRRQQSA